VNQELLSKVRSRGVSELDDEDVIAVVISGARDQAKSRHVAALLLEEFGGLRGLGRAVHHSGGADPLGEARRIRLAAALELGVRCLEAMQRPRDTIECSADIARLLAPRLERLPNEQVWVVALDARNHVIARRRVAEGGLHGCAIQASDVLRVVLGLGACSFVLVHNHPGGDPSPSRQDLILTSRLADAASCVGVPMVDHVIIGAAEHRSLLDLGAIVQAEPDESSRAAERVQERGSGRGASFT